MVDQINNSYDLGINSSLVQKHQDVQSIGNNALKKNPYSKISEVYDESSISKDAINLFERDKDIQKYTKMLSSVDQQDANNQVNDLIRNGKLNPSDSDLADSLMSDHDFMGLIFGE